MEKGHTEIQKNKAARQEFYALVGNDEWDQIVAEHWQMWKNGTDGIIELQNKDKNETHRKNKKNTEARQKFYAHVGIDELVQIVAEI